MTVRRRSVSRPDDALLDQITLFDLAMDRWPLWDQQRARLKTVE